MASGIPKVTSSCGSQVFKAEQRLCKAKITHCRLKPHFSCCPSSTRPFHGNVRVELIFKSQGTGGHGSRQPGTLDRGILTGTLVIQDSGNSRAYMKGRGDGVGGSSQLVLHTNHETLIF